MNHIVQRKTCQLIDIMNLMLLFGTRMGRIEMLERLLSGININLIGIN